MEQEQPKFTPPEICSIRVMFPAASDDQAIEIKKKIGAVISEIPNAHIEFSIRTMPKPPDAGI